MLCSLKSIKELFIRNYPIHDIGKIEFDYAEF